MFRTWPLSKRFALLSGPVLVGAGVLIGVVNHVLVPGEHRERGRAQQRRAGARPLQRGLAEVRSRCADARDSSAWRADLNREIASLIRHSSVVKVKLYRADGSVAYSTDPTATEEDEEGEAHSATAGGKRRSEATAKAARAKRVTAKVAKAKRATVKAARRSGPQAKAAKAKRATAKAARAKQVTAKARAKRPRRRWRRRRVQRRIRDRDQGRGEERDRVRATRSTSSTA